MIQDYPKLIKRKLRELAAEAYERDMISEMARLHEDFNRWRSGQIDVWALDRRIHEYHNGRARELYNQYSESSLADMLVAYAIVREVLSKDEIPAELWPYLERPLAFYHHLNQDYGMQSPAQEADEELEG